MLRSSSSKVGRCRCCSSNDELLLVLPLELLPGLLLLMPVLGADDNSDDNNSGNTTIDGQVTAMTVLRERSRDLGIPVVADLPVGHGSEGNAALPIGRPARLDGDHGRLRML